MTLTCTETDAAWLRPGIRTAHGMPIRRARWAYTRFSFHGSLKWPAVTSSASTGSRSAALIRAGRNPQASEQHGVAGLR